MEDVVLNRVDILGLFCPKQGQGFKPSAAHLYPNMGQFPPPLPWRPTEPLRRREAPLALIADFVLYWHIINMSQTWSLT